MWCKTQEQFLDQVLTVLWKYCEISSVFLNFLWSHKKPQINYLGVRQGPFHLWTLGPRGQIKNKRDCCLDKELSQWDCCLFRCDIFPRTLLWKPEEKKKKKDRISLCHPGSHTKNQASLELTETGREVTVETRLVWNAQRSASICHPSARTKGMHGQDWPLIKCLKLAGKLKPLCARNHIPTI